MDQTSATGLLGRRTCVRLLIGVLLLLLPAGCFAGENAASRWYNRFGNKPPRASRAGVCTGTIGQLPGFQVRPFSLGERLVRVSLPFAPGALPEGLGLRVVCGAHSRQADLRPLTWHSGQPRSVRRGMVTFVWPFDTLQPYSFQLQLAAAVHEPRTEFTRDAGDWVLEFHGLTLRMNPNEVRITSANGPAWHAHLIGPPLAGFPLAGPPLPAPQTSVKANSAATSSQTGQGADAGTPPATQRAEITKAEIIEAGNHYLWVRLLVYDDHWPRIL